MARVLGPKLSAAFKQSVVLDNRPGASGMIGIDTAVRASPDGYTMTMVSSSYAASAATSQLSHDPLTDTTPIVLLGTAPQLMVVHPSVPIASARELIAYAKANPGKLNYGSSGTGGSVHLTVEYLSQMAGISMTHVPYKGQGPALNDVIGGQIQVLSGSPMIIYPLVKSNRLRGIAVTSAKRSGAMPEIPAFAEIVPGFESLSWQAMLGPEGAAQGHRRALEHGDEPRSPAAGNEGASRQRFHGGRRRPAGALPRSVEARRREVAESSQDRQHQVIS